MGSLAIGRPNLIVTDCHIDVPEAPGPGVDIDPEAARRHLLEADSSVFD